MWDSFWLPTVRCMHLVVHVLCGEKQVCTKLIYLAILNENWCLSERNNCELDNQDS